MTQRHDSADGHSLGQARVKGRTLKALHVAVEDLGDVWIPKSVIHDDSEVYDLGRNHSDDGELIVQRWFAKKEGWCE